MVDSTRNAPEPDDTDPFLEEVRELKRDALRRAGGGLEGLFKRLREVEDSHRDRVVSPRAEAVSEAPSDYVVGDERPTNS